MPASKATRVLIVYPSSYVTSASLNRDEIKSSPWVLASYLSQHFDVTYMDFEISIGRPSSPTQVKRFERKVREYFEQNRFDVIAISCWTSLSYRAAWAVGRIAREVHPGSLLVVGGYHASARPTDFMSPDNVFDYVIKGEGEIATKLVASGFSVAGRPSQTQVLDSPALQPIHLAPVNWDLIRPILNTEHNNSVGTLTFFLSRGCPFKCSFCVESLKESTWRPFTPEAAIAQICEALETKTFHALGIGDACFGVQPAWRKKFLRMLREVNPSTWVLFETRPEYLDSEDIELLADMKIEIQFGVESCSPRMLEIMNKTKQPEKFLNSFREVSHRLSDHGIVHGANIILNHPGETEETLRETFAYIDEELKRAGSSVMWTCHGYMHFPGSTIDLNQDRYTQQYGARFEAAEWWKTDEDPYIASRRVVASSDLSGERQHLWKKMVKERDEAMRASMTSMAFKLAAETYFPEWQSDSRYDPTLR